MCYTHYPGLFKKVVYLQVEIERYDGKWVFMCTENLNNAELRKDHLGQKMTLDDTQQDIFSSQAHIFEIPSK